MAAEYHTSVPLDSFRGTRETKRVTAAFIPTTLLTVEERRLVRGTNLHVAFADSAGLYTIDISIVLGRGFCTERRKRQWRVNYSLGKMLSGLKLLNYIF